MPLRATFRLSGERGAADLRLLSLDLRVFHRTAALPPSNINAIAQAMLAERLIVFFNIRYASIVRNTSETLIEAAVSEGTGRNGLPRMLAPRSVDRLSEAVFLQPRCIQPMIFIGDRLTSLLRRTVSTLRQCVEADMSSILITSCAFQIVGHQR